LQNFALQIMKIFYFKYLFRGLKPHLIIKQSNCVPAVFGCKRSLI
jgi:hypothetical protein